MQVIFINSHSGRPHAETDTQQLIRVRREGVNEEVKK